MIICTNCNHQNPEGSVQCENCYAPLPKTSPCPHCGAFIQTNATFCGQCGYNLQSEESFSSVESVENSENLLESFDEQPSKGMPKFDDFDDSDLNLFDKDTIPAKAEDSRLNSPWDTETGGPQDIPVNRNLPLEKDLMSSGSLNFEAEVYQGPPDEVDEVDEVEVKNLAELERVAEEQFSLDTNSENDSLELDFDLDLALDAELPEMSDIEDLESTTAALASEMSEMPEIAESPLLEQLEVASPELDIASEIPEIAESSLLEELAVANPELNVASEIPEIAEISPLEELEVSSPELDVASEMPESSNLITSEISAIEHPRSSSRPMSPVSESATQLQLQRIILFHVQSGDDIELSQNSDIIRIGKPNSQIPPDIDVSGFPDSNIVSRIHANIRVEGDTYFIEDLGSSNGTYINHKPLLTGNRHRLRCGDRISLGKGDLMTFIFKIID